MNSGEKSERAAAMPPDPLDRIQEMPLAALDLKLGREVALEGIERRRRSHSRSLPGMCHKSIATEGIPHRALANVINFERLW